MIMMRREAGEGELCFISPILSRKLIRSCFAVWAGECKSGSGGAGGCLLLGVSSHKKICECFFHGELGNVIWDGSRRFKCGLSSGRNFVFLRSLFWLP